jgi:predicted dehydrogenase
MFMSSDSVSRRNFLKSTTALAGGIALGLEKTVASAKTVISTSPRIRIAQVGTTHGHARGKMESLRKLSDYYEVIGIFEADAQKKEQAMQRDAYKGLHWFESLEQLLNAKDLKAVAVETFNKDLVPTSMVCAKAGVHIHMDKPGGESHSQFKVLLDEMIRQNRTLQMGYMFRNNPGFQFCFDAVKKGWLGDVFEVHGVMSKTTSARSRKALAQYPGGTMYELGGHLIDPLIAIMGRPDRVSSFTRKTKPDQDNLNDNQLAVFEYPKATATIRSALVEVEGSRRRQFYVCGDKGTVEIKPLEKPRTKLMLALDRDRGKFKKGYHPVELAEMTGRYDDLLIEFAKVINGQIENRFAPSHDLMVHEAVLRASGLSID